MLSLKSLAVTIWYF